MIRPLTLCLALAACGTTPQANWPTGPAGPTPALLPLDALAGDGTLTDARGATLAAKAAALKARAAAIGG